MHGEDLNGPERSPFAPSPLGLPPRRSWVQRMSEPTNPIPSSPLRPNGAWTLDDVAAFLGCNPRTVRRLLAEDPTFPAPRQVGRRLLWAPGALPGWLERAGEQTASPSARSRARAPRVAPKGVSARV